MYNISNLNITSNLLYLDHFETSNFIIKFNEIINNKQPSLIIELGSFNGLIACIMAKEIKQADLFVLPGTGGLALQQAMSFGLPVIVAEGDGTQDDLVTNQNGWKIYPGDEHDLNQKLMLAIENRAALPKMGRESYRIVKDEINISVMADVFIKAIQKAKEHYEK